MTSWSKLAAAVVVAVVVLVAGCTGDASEPSVDDVSSSTERTAADAQPDDAGEEDEAADRGGENESEEESELTQERLEAFESAAARGDIGAGIRVVSDPAPGWTGQRLLNPGTDDWEPAIAADPRAPYVYLLTTRYGEPKTCPKHCPTPYLPLTVSADGGRTWDPQRPLCVCRGAGAQYDPTIEVVPNTGAVYSVFLNADRHGAFSTAFIKSENHGRTWTDPVRVYGNVAWTDKPEITSSANGRHVYVSWNGPQGGDLYVGISHDYGETWSQQKLSDSKRYYFAYDATSLSDGTVVFSESSLSYSGPGQSVEGRVWHHAVISRDQGRSWRDVVVDKVALGEPCVADGCSDDYYAGQTSVANDSGRHLVFAYEGATFAGGPQRVYVRTSDDAGRTWSNRVALSKLGENATGPRVDLTSDGEARLWFMQTSGGGNPDAWNVRFRSSGDGGTTWGPAVRLSDASSGPGYVGRNGFREIYGDYGEIAITNRDKAIAVWGEGFSYIGPGGTWYAREK